MMARYACIINRLAVSTAWLAAGCALALAGCSDSTSPGEAAVPTVVHPDAWEAPVLTEADVLADRLLRREDDGLLLDATERRELAG